MDQIASAPASYDPVMRAVHWTTLALIVAMFATAWIAHSGLAGDYYRPTMQLHRSLGLSVLALTVFRLVWRSRVRIPALPTDLPAVQKLAAHVTEAVLYALLIAQPLLGLLQTNACGQRVDFFFLSELPPVIDPDRALAR